MNNEFNNINPSSNVPNQANNNYPINPNGYSNVGNTQVYQQQPVISATAQYNQNIQPQQSNMQINYAQQTQPIVQASTSYPQQTIVPAQQQMSYPQTSQSQIQPQVSYAQQTQPVIQAQPSYPQQTQTQVPQTNIYAQSSPTPVITANSQMPQNIQPVVASNIQPQVQIQPQIVPEPVTTSIFPQNVNMPSTNNFAVGQIPVSNLDMTTGISEPNIFNNNNQLPVQFSTTNPNSTNTEEPPKKSLKDKLSFLKNKKIIVLGIVLILVILVLIFGVNKLLSGSFGHGYSVEEGTKININETTSSKNKYKFSVDVIETKDISIAKTKYKGYKLAITNTGSGKLKLDGFDIEFTIRNSETGEITSTTVFLSNSYMSLAPDSFDKDLLPLEVPRGKTVEGYIYFKTAVENVEILDINVYKNVAGIKATYTINFKQPSEDDEEDTDEDESSENEDDISDEMEDGEDKSVSDDNTTQTNTDDKTASNDNSNKAVENSNNTSTKKKNTE